MDSPPASASPSTPPSRSRHLLASGGLVVALVLYGILLASRMGAYAGSSDASGYLNNARLLRDVDGNNTDYKTNSVHLAGGESADVILEAAGSQAGQKFYLYAAELDHLSNDAENFGGMMTEVNICKTGVNPTTKKCL